MLRPCVPSLSPPSLNLRTAVSEWFYLAGREEFSTDVVLSTNISNHVTNHITLHSRTLTTAYT